MQLGPLAASAGLCHFPQRSGNAERFMSVVVPVVVVVIGMPLMQAGEVMGILWLLYPPEKGP